MRELSTATAMDNFTERCSKELESIPVDEREPLISGIVNTARETGISTDDLMQFMDEGMGFFELALMVFSRAQQANEESQ